jgi:transcriptional regulator with XRE-family HTH domain
LRFVSVTCTYEYTDANNLSTDNYTFVNIFPERLDGLMGKEITQEDVAKAVGVSQPTVARWLKGSAINGEDLLKVANFFGVSPFVLMGMEPLPSSALRESPAEYLIDELGEEIKRMKEQLHAVERAAHRLKKGKL